MNFKIPRSEYKGDLADYPLENYPDYEPGCPPRFEKLAQIGHLEEEERVWGQKWGEQGIGRLREIALVKPTDYEIQPLFKKDPTFFMLRHHLMTGSKLSIDALQQQHEDYAKLMEENGVKVRYMEFEDYWGAYGPLRKPYVAARLGTAVRGGVIIKRWGHGSWSRGLERHAMKFFLSINCPILLYPAGKAIFEGTMVFPAENVAIGHYGLACNREAMEQVNPVLKAAGFEEVVMGHSSTVMDSYSGGGYYHSDLIMSIVDLGLALVVPSQLDWDVYMWLKEHKYKLIEVPPEELLSCVAVNGMPLGNRKIVMPKAATKTNALLRKEGVDVIELDTSGLHGLMMGGLRCMTMRLYREPGPRLEELK